MQRRLRVMNIQPKVGKSGKQFTIITFFDSQSGQQFDASSFDAVNYALMGQDVIVDLKTQGQYTNVNNIQLAPGQGMPPQEMPTPAAKMPPAAPPGQWAQPLGPQPQAPPNIPPPPMPQPATPDNLSRKDIMIARMSALRGATEVVAQQILILAQAGNPPDVDTISEMIQSRADLNLVYVLKNEIPDSEIPF